MIWILALHLIAALVCLAPGEHARRWTLGVATVPPLVGFVWLCTQAGSVLDGRPVVESVEWVPQIGLNLDLRLDGFALLMGLLVTGIGVLVLIYSISYFHHERADRPDGGPARRLRRGDARARPLQRTAHPLRVLGAHVDHVVLAHRLRRPLDRRPHRRRPGAAGDRDRWAVACSPGSWSCWPAGRQWTISQLLADAPTGAVVNVALRAGTGRRLHQVRPVALPLLAARRHGRPDAGVGLPALRHHGEGGDRGRRAVRAGLRRGRPVAADGRDRRA